MAMGEGFIVIDDLVDTGGTAVAIPAKCIQSALCHHLCKNPVGRPLVDDYVVDIPQDTWIEQPWDMGVGLGPRQSPVANLFNAWHCRALFFLTSGGSAGFQ